jgi:hypothetical protein
MPRGNILAGTIIPAETPPFSGWSFERAAALLPNHHTAAGDRTAFIAGRQALGLGRVVWSTASPLMRAWSLKREDHASAPDCISQFTMPKVAIKLLS